MHAPADAGLQRAPVALLGSTIVKRSWLGRPGKGMEGLVGYARRNFFVPIRFGSWDASPASSASATSVAGAGCGGTRRRSGSASRATAPPCCHCRGPVRPRGRRGSHALPPQRLLGPTAYGHREVLVKGYVDDIVIVWQCAPAIGSYEREV